MNIEKAILNPGSEFTHPDEILSEQTLTHELKIKILRRWEYDARELEVAEEENMGGGPPSMLGEILEALRHLDYEADVDHPPPTKQGGA
jgi:hypothetical protein